MKILKEMHNKHHFGVNRIWYLERMSMLKLKKEGVVKCIRNCGTCQSIDPAPVRIAGGVLEVKDNWKRTAINVSNYKGKRYLSVVGYGPSRYTIWINVKE